MVATLDRQRGVCVKLIAGLVDPPIAGENKTGKNQRLRFSPALSQPALDK